MEPRHNDRIVNEPWTQGEDCEWALDTMTRLLNNPGRNDKIVNGSQTQ